MSLDDAYAPLTAEEHAAAPKPSARASKEPIVPVPDDAPALNFKHPAYGRPVAVWAYRDATGALLGYDARFEYLDKGKPAKDVLPLAFCQVGDKRGWRSKAMPAPRTIYGADRLAERLDAPVLVVEGCKCAVAAGELLPSYVAVAWQGGGNAAHMTDWSALAGREVTVWPDRDRHADLAGAEKPYEDQSGTITARQIVNRLRPIAATVALLDLSDLEVKDGWDIADAQADGWSEADALAFLAERARPAEEDEPEVRLPYGFEYSDNDLYFVEEARGDNLPARIRVAGRFKVAARTRDLSGGSWGLLLEWADADGRQHSWAMPRSMLAGDGGLVRETMLDLGLYVGTTARARGKLLEFLASVDTDARARAVDRVGWANDTTFVLPEETIGDTSAERVIFQSSSPAPHPYSQRGTLAEWKEHVGKLALGNSRLIFTLSAAFVGPALLPCEEESGGFNIKGPSSTGKTTGLRMAASVWGKPSGFIRQWRATANGLEGTATQHSETLLCLDELAQLDPKEAGSVAYMLANEQGKVRANRTGAARASANWKLFFLSTGEISLGDLAREHVSSGKRKSVAAGQEVRVIDLPADAGRGLGLFENLRGAATPAAFARQITASAGRYYGVAGPAFVAALIPLRPQLLDMIAGHITDFMTDHVPPEADGQVQRGARRFALVAAAGELAAAVGILPWAEGAATAASAVMYRAWVDQRGGLGSAEERNYLRALSLFLSEHGSSRFANAGANDDEGSASYIRTVNRAGFWRVRASDGRREYLIFKEVFRSEIFAGMDVAAAEKILADRGILRRDGQGKFTCTQRLPEMGSPRVYVIGPEIFDVEA